MQLHIQLKQRIDLTYSFNQCRKPNIIGSDQSLQNIIFKMGQQLPQVSCSLSKLTRQDQFESKYVQRLKQTPFIDAEIINTNPLMFADGMGLRLSQLIKPRIGTKQLFPEQQVQKLIVNVLNGLKDLQQNGFEGHGDLSLQTIYYSKKQKYFKLAHPAFNEESGYLLTKHGKRFTALSPEQLSALSEQSENTEISVQSDLFGLGIVLCEVCTLTASSDIYCPDTYSIFHLQIQKRLKLIQNYYSNKIAEAVSDCLIYDPQQRIDIRQLLQRFLQPKPKSIIKDLRPQKQPIQ